MSGRGNPVSTDYLPVRLFSSECPLLEALKEQAAVDGNINVPVFRLRFFGNNKVVICIEDRQWT